MPPHDTEIRIPLTVNAEIGGPLDRNITYTTTDTNTTGGNPNGTTWTTTTVDPYAFARDVWTTDNITINADALRLDTDYLGQRVRIALDRVLDMYFRTLYKIIVDHCRIDISEDEFMKLIKETNNE